MHNEMWRDVVSESVRRLRLSQLSGCIFYLSEECFQEVFKNRKTLFNCLKKRYNHSIKTGRCSLSIFLIWTAPFTLSSVAVIVTVFPASTSTL